MNTQTKYLGLITCLYITFELVSNVTAGKLIDVFGQPVAVTVYFFPFTYIFSDILTEVYGYARARAVLWIVMLCTILSTVIYSIVVVIPPSTVFEANEAYLRVLGVVPQIVLAAWLAIFAGDIANNYVMSKMKILTKGRMLWSRTITSTILGQLVNTIIFYSIALYGTMPNDAMLKAIIYAWIIKTLVEILMTPVTYLVVNKLKKVEGIDHYDYNTNFNPFVFRTPF
jgi:uncharacterized integral membrane protein (TIGR00697 family)